MSPTDAKESIGNKYEESKQAEFKEISKEEAVCYMLRLKVFVDTMCLKIKDKVPFRELFELCHEQLTLAEPIIFKD